MKVGEFIKCNRNRKGTVVLVNAMEMWERREA
jgi:hypothetical protein